MIVPAGVSDPLSMYLSARQHVDAQTTMSSQIIACSANFSIARRFLDPARTFWRTTSAYGDTLIPREELPREFEYTWELFDTLSTFSRTISVHLDKLMPSIRFRHKS